MGSTVPTFTGTEKRHRSSYPSVRADRMVIKALLLPLMPRFPLGMNGGLILLTFTSLSEDSSTAA